MTQPERELASGPAESLFHLRDVKVIRSGRPILTVDDLHLPASGPIALAGPSGSGKSTLLRLLNRLEAPSEGAVAYRGRNIANADIGRHRRRVAMVFQRPVVLPGSVGENLRQADQTLDSEEIQQALARVGLDPDLADRDARDLSGGEAQRMCLARSLATGPDVVLFDEPTSALDGANARRIEELALELETQGITTIWVTHDLDQLRRLARQVVIIIDGAIGQAGTRSSVLDHPTDPVAAFLVEGTPAEESL